MSGPVSGALSYAAAKGGDTLRMNASLKRARLSRTIAADEASVSVEGPLKTLALRYAIKGWANEQPFDLGGEGQGGIDKSGMNAAIAVKGAFAGAPIATREPISARLSGDVLQAAGAVTLDHGSLQASWRSDKTNAAIDARFDEAPLEVLTAMLEQPAAGALSGEMHLAGAKKSLSGAADLTFKEARMARRSRDVVNARLTATLGGGALHGRLEARSGRGLAATLEGETPMVAEAAPFRLAPRAGGVTTATWKVDGPVEGLWALFGPLDQSLSGQINGAGDMRVAEAGVSGRGQVTLTAGAFDDKISGVKLRQVNAALSFDDQGMTLNRFEATDGLQGRVTGSGRLDVQDSGKLSLTLANMRLFDRPEGRATGDGDLTLEWRKGGATLGGTIRLAQAEMRLIDGAATAPLPQIDVVEINRPGPPPRAAKRGGSVIASKLDVRIIAPGRVYTRTRGLEAEWAMDVRLTGDVAHPALFGEARVVRGDFLLAGRRFDLDHGAVRFAGAPEDAEIDVLAIAETQTLTANLALTGRAIDPKVELSSQPALPEDEILPELLFGRTSRELSGFEAAQLAASLATLAGRSAFDIAGAARAAVDLDRLEVREDMGGFLVAGGKYLTRNVYVEVSGNAVGQAGTAIEWQVRPRFFLISSFLPTGDQKVAIRWRHDY
jgi:translocation and assembly module TamB